MRTIWECRESLAWFTGIYEGEGCLVIRSKDSARTKKLRTNLTISIGMTDRDVVERVHAVAAVGQFGPVKMKKAKPHHKDQWGWLLSRSDQVYAVCLAMLPLLGHRRAAHVHEAIGLWLADKPWSAFRTEERVWWHVDKLDDHWLWTGHIDAYGFGTMQTGSDSRRRVQVHRVVYEQEHGIDLGRIRLKNLCGIKHCVHPDHWERDARYLDDAQVQEIRCMLEHGATPKALAEQFGVSRSLIHDIRYGKRLFALPRAS